MQSAIDIYEVSQSELEETKDMLKARFDQIIGFYVEDTAGYIKSIKEGVAQGDAEMVVASAHPLKSSSAALGFLGFAALAKHIEELGRTVPQDIQAMTNIALAVAQVDASFAHVTKTLQQFTAK